MSQADLEAAPRPAELTIPGARDAAGDKLLWLALGLFLAATFVLGAGIMMGDAALSRSLILLGAGFFGLASISTVATMRRARTRRWRLDVALSVVRHDTAPSFLTDAAGVIVYRNPAAEERFRGRMASSLTQAFMDVFANPAAVIFRLQSRAEEAGHASEDIVTRKGQFRLHIQAIDDTTFLWRVEGGAGAAGSGRAADALSLPMLTAGPSGTILFMNEAFRKLTGGRVRTLDKVFLDLPVRSGQIMRVETLDGIVESLVAEVSASGGRKEIYLLPAVTEAGVPASIPSGWDAIEALPVPLLKVAATGEVLASNREARALLPMPVGRETRLSDLLQGLGRPIIDWLRETAEGRGTPGPQFLRGTGPHRDTFVQVSLNPAGETDEPHLIAVLNDVTELKSLEAQFVQSQKMQAIGQLAGGVAHDFNNLLTAISGHCDLLLLRHDENDADFGDLTQIRQNVNRAASLVRQLLAFSRKQNLMPETIDLRESLSELTHLLNRLVGEKVVLTLTHDPDLSAIRADKRQLEQVFMNLVVNARDAMPDGGKIQIHTEDVELAQPLARDRATVPAGSYVRTCVTDEGTGIPPEQVNQIFEPFYTTKRQGEGTGLGLSTVYGIVKQTGGFIFADSTPGEGTTFTLYFPTEAPEAPSDDAQSEPAPAARPGAAMSDSEGTVLLVEDEAPVRAFASRALRLKGYSVLEADSAEAALKLLEDPELKVDIFVTDVIMPGKDGPTWVKEALRTRASTSVVFVSGYAEDAFAEHKSLIPNSDFLPKPFSLTDLTSIVAQQLENRRSQLSDDAPPDAPETVAGPLPESDIAIGPEAPPPLDQIGAT